MAYMEEETEREGEGEGEGEGMDDSEMQASLDELTRPIKDVKEKWKLLPHFLRIRGLMRQHIDSFDHFINVDIKQIVAARSNFEIRSESDPKFFLRYTDIYLGTPNLEEEAFVVDTVTPFQCRLRDCTYSAPLFVDIKYTKPKTDGKGGSSTNIQIVTKRGLQIGRIPIMLRSEKCVLRNKSPAELAALKECEYDPGGYFVVKGNEKVILMHEQLSKNRVIIELDPKGNVSAAITSSTHDRKSRCSIFFKSGKVYLKHNSLGDDIPIVVALKAMGLETDQEIVQLVGTDLCDQINESLEEPYHLGLKSQEACLNYIGMKVKAVRENLGAMNAGRSSFNRKQQSNAAEAVEVLAHVVLNHVPVLNYDFRPKVVYMTHIVRRVLRTVQDKTLLDDKDYYGNKRLELAGSLISLLFEDLFKRFNTDLKRQADMVLSKTQRAATFDIVKHMRSDTITQGFVHAISTGSWVLKRFRMDRAGVTQVLSRLSYIGALGMMTRVSSQFEKTRKVSGPRSLQPSQWGMMCLCDTPEGEACGLVKNLALLAHVTIEGDDENVLNVCIDLGVEDVTMVTGEEINAPDTYLVFLNGLIVGVHERPDLLVDRVRQLRRVGRIGEFVSVYLNVLQKAVYIASDGGRVCRPLLVLDEEGNLKISQHHIDSLDKGTQLEHLIEMGVIEYVDVNEENNCLVALTHEDLTPNHTHMEIDPLTILGVVAGLVPNPHHNQSPRNTYQCAMGKQAIGTTAYNQYERFDTLLYTMVYPHKPMVKTRTLDLVNFDKLPGGQNASLAVMSYSGYDIEDAIILNRGSIDRGFGRCIVVKKFGAVIKRYSNETSDQTQGPVSADTFPQGEDDIRYKKQKYLDPDGICKVGSVLEPNYTIINKFSPTNTGEIMDINSQMNPSNVEYKPSKITYKGSARATVDKVLITSNEHDNFIVKVLMRQIRRPEVGDKFSSRHGQKGVCGLIINQEDMPFSEMGVCPDLIMNPHGFPSRMTVGKMIELVSGKAGVFAGRQGYASAFGEKLGNADRVEDVCNELVTYGYNYMGKDLLTSGVSGEPLESYVFTGPVFYQKLKHMVMDKMHARAKGPRAVLTRQPTEGRSRDGGLRLGEMERDCLIGYGASNLIVERLMISSDAFTANVCEGCGLLGYEGFCQRCRTGEHVSAIRLPYACKLLFQELQSMNIATRLRLQDF